MGNFAQWVCAVQNWGITLKVSIYLFAQIFCTSQLAFW